MQGNVRKKAGRKSKAEEMGLQSLLDMAWPKEKRLALFVKLSEMAETGNLEATKLLMAYTFGKPREYHEISGGVQIRLVDDTSDSDSE